MSKKSSAVDRNKGSTKDHIQKEEDGANGAVISHNSKLWQKRIAKINDYLVQIDCK